ncbi:MAG: aldehyde dehydrogenase family protein [Methanomassiliicoccales archaeon]|nr:aldehyde dehydrogenase family protein [Methanomassiliicoccales archaeon]
MSTSSNTAPAAGDKPDPTPEIAALIERARTSMKAIEHFTQAEADELVMAIGWHVVKECEALARLAVEEGGFGNYTDKLTKIRLRVTGTIQDMQSVKTVGIVEEDPKKGLVKIAKPVGVVAAIIPSTGPDATPPMKALCAAKGLNAIIVAAHPKTQKSSELAVNLMRQGCKAMGVPEDLIQIIQNPTIAKTQELMRQADLIVATGGAGMVKAAYSSGTPAYGVGVGNTVHIVDETGDIDDAAFMIARAKVFDYATSCLADNSVLAHESIYDSLVEKLVQNGAYICNAEEKARLQKVMWPKGGPIPSLDVIAKPAGHIANLANIDLPEDRTFLVVEETGTGPDYPFSGEKLSVVLSLYRYEGEIQNAVDLTNRITEYQGLGHSCGIHTSNDKHVDALAFGTRTGRVMVNQNMNEGAGSPRNGLPFTLSLSCGTWGGNITTENVNARHFVNLTWVSRIVQNPKKPPTDEELFSAYWEKYGR